MSVKNKMLVIAPFLISIAVSIELDRKYYFDIYEFFIFLFVSLMVFVNIYDYVNGRDMLIFGNKLKAGDNKLLRFYWLFLMVIVYLGGIFHFLFKV
ncbi:hypothetical protein [Moraxella sp.]|uniref:hypothetical protein n=1 Tax=Moraxella sp. TaxID=479 RepID=UPI0026DCF13B|nr:hypothetical protein [Moraxella sp.]MDO4894334.1 hypothetical protein [Moraxella sp.]